MDLFSLLQRVTGSSPRNLAAASTMALSPGLARITGLTGGNQNRRAPTGFITAQRRKWENALQDLGRRAVETQRAQAPQQQNPLDQLLEQMQGYLQGGGGATSFAPDMDDLMSQVSGQINPVYDARRDAIGRLLGRTQERIGAGRQDVESMYSALGDQYGIDAERAGELMGESQEASRGLHGQLKKNIQGNYSRIQEEQADLFSKLGIEAAAPEVLGAQAEDQAWLEGQADTRSALSEDYFNQIGAADQAYYQQGAPLARLEGSNRSADLLAMLEDYTARTDANLMELEGQRTSDITSAFNQLAMQAQQFAQQQAAQANQGQWGQMMDMYGILRDQYGQEQQVGEAPPTLDYLGIGQQLGLGPAENRQLQSAVAQLQSLPAFEFGQIQNPNAPNPTATTVAAAQQAIRQLAQESNLSPRVQQALMIWAQGLYG